MKLGVKEMKKEYKKVNLDEIEVSVHHTLTQPVFVFISTTHQMVLYHSLKSLKRVEGSGHLLYLVDQPIICVAEIFDSMIM